MRFSSDSSLGWGLLLGALLACGGPPRAQAQQKVESDGDTGQWERLDGCRLAAGNEGDGDSFHVIHRGREYVFRLYFVDAPETGAAFGERVEDQAAYFGLPPADIPALGKAAKEFARERLAQEFTVVTRWQNARGMSSLARFYAIVLVRGQNLAYDLVSAGFARIHGLRATWPEGERASTVLSRLKNAELAAREKKLGAWGWTKAATAQAGPENSAASGKPPAPKSATPAPLVDLNSATAAALMTLPGIGEKLAERIIAARPYATVEDLTRVSGIGPKTFERLRPLVTVAAK